jgi:hypothetical protein
VGAAGILPAEARGRNGVTIRRLIVGNVLLRRLRIGLLVSGIASLLAVLAGTAPADAALTANGQGMTLTVVSAQLVNNKTAVNVNLAVTCTPAPNDAGMFSVINFTLSENSKGVIVSYQGGTGNNYPPITCDGTSHAVTFTLLPQNGATSYKPGPAYISNGNAAAFPSDSSCGTTIYGGQTVPLPCDYVNTFSGGVQING